MTAGQAAAARAQDLRTEIAALLPNCVYLIVLHKQSRRKMEKRSEILCKPTSLGQIDNKRPEKCSALFGMSAFALKCL
jgi:hypothetical protein